MKPNKLSVIITPTGDRRHTSKVRDGKQSSEVYCKDNKRRDELGLPPIPRDDGY